jgi:hypothetical protein
MTGENRPTKIEANLALKTILDDSEWMFKTGVGGTINAICLVLSLASTFCLPVVVALMSLTNGYVLRVARVKASGLESKLPAWNEWLDLIISGLTWQAIQFGLFLVPLTAGTVCLLVGAASGAIKVSSQLFLPWAVTAFLATFLSWSAMSLLSRFMMINFAIEERVQSGLAVGATLRRIWSNPGDFLSVWLLSLGLQLAALILPALTVVGIFLIPSTLFVAEMLGASIAAQVWTANKR